MPIGETTKSMLAKLDPDKRAKLEAALAEVDDFATEIEQGYLRQADYTKKTQELSDRRKTLETNWETANAEYQRMLADNAKVQETLDATQAEKDEAARKLAEAEEKLKSAPVVDPAKFLSREDFKKELGEEIKRLAGAQTAYFGSTLRIQNEHRKLFNEDIDPQDLIQSAMAEGKTPQAYWEEKHKVADKRRELALAEETKKLDAARDEGYRKAIAEQANPATRSLRPSDNPFYTPTDEKADPWDTSTPTKADTEFKEALTRAFSS